MSAPDFEEHVHSLESAERADEEHVGTVCRHATRPRPVRWHCTVYEVWRDEHRHGSGGTKALDGFGDRLRDRDERIDSPEQRAGSSKQRRQSHAFEHAVVIRRTAETSSEGRIRARRLFEIEARSLRAGSPSIVQGGHQCATSADAARSDGRQDPTMSVHHIGLEAIHHIAQSPDEPGVRNRRRKRTLGVDVNA